MRIVVFGFFCVFGAQSSFAQVCGDGAVDAGEQCDDGNTIAKDGCDASCRFEGSVIIEKVHGGSETPAFEFSPSYGSHFSLTRGAINFSGFLPSSVSHTVSEVNIPVGWQLTDIDCRCFQINTPGNDITLPCQSEATPDLLNNRVVIALRGAELMRCNFSNTLVGCSGASCAVCGNGVVDADEECDNGAANSDSVFGPGACTTECKFAVKNCVIKARDLARGCNQGKVTDDIMLSLFLICLGVFCAARSVVARQRRATDRLAQS